MRVRLVTLRIGIGSVATIIAAILPASLLTGGQLEQSKAQSYSVKVDLTGSDGSPIRSAFMELQAEGHKGGIRASGDANGRIVASTPAGTYALTIEAGGFNNLSGTIAIDGDVDLGRVVMDTDPKVVHAGAASIAGPPRNPPPKNAEPKTVAIGSNPVVLRGRIEPASAIAGRRLKVQVSCSEQQPTLPERPPIDRDGVPVDDTGHFEVGVPSCSNERLVHRELRLSLKDEAGATVALLLPRLTPEGYHQSRLGIWLPLKLNVPEWPRHEATFCVEFTGNRPIHATITVSAETIPPADLLFLVAVLTNTSDEVLSISSTDFASDYEWIISDDTGKRVPHLLSMDRTGEPPDRIMPRSTFLFPGQSDRTEINIGVFFNLSSPGTYHVVAKRIVRRPGVGEEQISSPETTFVVAPPKNGHAQ